MVGRVDAPQRRWETYSLKLKGLNREILVTDGDFRGVAGTHANWRQLATEAFAVVRGG